jgi:hypothetical protein
MNNDLILGSKQIGKGSIRRIGSPLGRRIECLSGSLWVTQDGDRRDIVLAPGQSFVFDRSEGVLVSALGDSRYLLLDGATPRH